MSATEKRAIVLSQNKVSDFRPSQAKKKKISGEKYCVCFVRYQSWFRSHRELSPQSCTHHCFFRPYSTSFLSRGLAYFSSVQNYDVILGRALRVRMEKYPSKGSPVKVLMTAVWTTMQRTAALC